MTTIMAVTVIHRISKIAPIKGDKGLVQTIFTNLTADGRPRTAIILQRGRLRSAVRCQKIAKRRFQRSANHIKKEICVNLRNL